MDISVEYSGVRGWNKEDLRGMLSGLIIQMNGIICEIWGCSERRYTGVGLQNIWVIMEIRE